MSGPRNGDHLCACNRTRQGAHSIGCPARTPRDAGGYHLFLTPEEMRDIAFVGGRYCWSEALLANCEAGENAIPEPVAWELAEAFERDTEGGHSPFPMLSGRSDLCDKLTRFWEGII